MDKSSKLADLRLVNKYYPVTGVANYSYPSLRMESTPAGRSSVGSQASWAVPDMVDDRDSVISIEVDDEDSYHSSGAELWDSFWEDPFWEANAEEASREADGITQRIIANSGSYPALIPSPEESLNYVAHDDNTEDMAAQEEFRRSRPPTPKPTYSLFPKPKPTQLVELTPKRPRIPPRNTALWDIPAHNKNSSSRSSLGRSPTVRRTQMPVSDTGVLPFRSSWAHSAPITQVILGPAPPAVDVSNRRDSAQSLTQGQRFPLRLSRARSDTLLSFASMESTPYPRPFNTSPHDLSLLSPPALVPFRSPPRIPQRSPPRSQDRHSQPEVHRTPHQIQTHRCMTENRLPMYSQHQIQGSPHLLTRTCPSSPAWPPPSPGPMPVSVFEDDSDEESGEERRSFRSRFTRTFAPRTRSASAALRSRKGKEFAKGQLRRTRADTIASPSDEGSDRSDEKDKESYSPPLRKQKSEVFGKMFWSRR